jgi:tRNA(fMet)-specific endonuclease VapC
MAIYLLDTSVIIDVLNGKRARASLLEELLRAGSTLACSAINVAEVYAGMHPKEASATDAFLSRLDYYDITWKVARSAGRLRYEQARRGRTLSLADTMIASVALTNGLILMTDNRKDFMITGLELYPLEP